MPRRHTILAERTCACGCGAVAILTEGEAWACAGLVHSLSFALTGKEASALGRLANDLRAAGLGKVWRPCSESAGEAWCAGRPCDGVGTYPLKHFAGTLREMER